ncbi:MEDS domain-containing protein [Micromonospora sp. CPCC 205556]|uniref:MEDS domain-containing protein n=1 Tax=Micromonospora sp. CPCC 205556 TaxID=3122398 RepID=UPI002FF30355
MRVTASAVADQVSLGDHVCWAHDGEAGGLDAGGRFAARGLSLGHKVVWFTDATSPAVVRAHLDGVGVLTEAALAGGRLRIVPAVESYLTGGRFSADAMVEELTTEVARARRDERPGLRLIGDMSWAVRHGVPVADLCRYEAETNRVFLDGDVAGMCLYDRRLFPAEYLRPIAAAHPATVGPDAARTWTPMLRAYRTLEPYGLRLVGQVDRSNREAFAALLGQLTGRAPTAQPCVVDVSELSFADGSAASALVRARRVTPAGVRLVGCRPALHRLLDLVDGTDRPGYAT